MADYLNQALFGFYPYVALSVFLIASLVRFDSDQYAWRSGSSQLLRRKLLFVGSNAFHIGVLFILAGHFIGLLTPHGVFKALGFGNEAHQLLAMISGGAFGVLCFVGLTLLIYRRLVDPRIRATSSRMDIAILLLIYAQLILGLGTIPVSAQHLDGSEMLMLADWAQHIVTFRGGAAALIAGVNPIFKLHILLGLTIFLLFPFSRLVHIWSAPIWYIGRPYQLVRRRGGVSASKPR